MNTGRKDDNGKPPWHLLPFSAVEQVVNVLAHGASKYGENNWLHVDRPKERYFSAALRHLVAYQSGEWSDKESGLPHLAHAICSLVFLLVRDTKAIPIFKEEEIYINEKDVRVYVDTPGHPAVRVTHVPSGEIVISTSEQSQELNKAKAISILKMRLADIERYRRSPSSINPPCADWLGPK